MSSPIVTAFNLPPGINWPIVDLTTGMPTLDEERWRSNLQRILQNMASVEVDSFGSRAAGDDTQAVQLAVGQAIRQGGGIVYFSGRTYNLGSVVIPALSNGTPTPPIVFAGQGTATILKRKGTLQPGMGMIDVSSSHFSMTTLVVDGGVTAPRGLQYNKDFLGIAGNDPMAQSLTQNTSVWVHGPVYDASFDTVIFQHAAGYSLLLDALSGDVVDTHMVRCRVENNRPALFGTNPADLNYGAWSGVIFAKAYGRTANSGIISGFLVALCHFERNDGNCLWNHPYGFTRFSENFRFIGNYFEDCGLDGILLQGVQNGEVGPNVLRRIGYTTVDDTTQSVPRWLVNANATGLDSGQVLGVPYHGNAFLNVNGGCLDLDGHGDSALSGNVCKISEPGDPAYVEDQVAISGPTNSGSESYGVNMGNSANTPYGGKRVQISGNTFINLSGGAIRMFAARECQASGNNITHPAAPINPPISLGPVGPGPYQRATDNKICHNRVTYAPGTAQPVVKEDASAAAFVATDVNQVFGNCPIFPAGSNAVEFSPDANSGSPTYHQTVWFP
jgi:hypothetical protein